MMTLSETAALLRSYDKVLILSHRNPDGDTLGSATALCRAYLDMGKQARIFCHDAVPDKFAYLLPEMPDFTPDVIVSVDVADAALLGERTMALLDGRTVALAIDHHPTHRLFAEKLYLEGTSASCCEIIWELLVEMGCPITKEIADCLYTGVATDTGCFKFSNTSPRTHKIAAELMEAGADYVAINKVMFDTKTFPELKLEQLALENLYLSEDGKIAILTITTDMLQKTGMAETGLDAITTLPRQIEGVEAGVTIKQRAESEFKVSLRTGETLDASHICGKFGGGGHARAAGCQFDGLCPEEIRRQLLDAIREEMYGN
jgi:phosphoesterase RecJ-like protein